MGIIMHNTCVVNRPDGTRAVVLHNTEIVTVYPNGNIRLDTGGWRTATTRARMNDVAQEWKLGFNVSFSRGRFLVLYGGRGWDLGNATGAVLSGGAVLEVQ